MTFPPLHRLVCICAVLLLTSGVTVAQHDPVTGGGMIGGSTERSTKPKTTKPASTTTTTPRKRPTPATVKRPAPVTSTVTADSYYQQGEALQREEIPRSARSLFKGHADQSVDVVSALPHRLDLQRSRRLRIRCGSNEASDCHPAQFTPRPISSWAILPQARTV